VRYTDVIHVLDRILKLHGFPVQESLLILQSPLACQHPLDTSAEIANSYHHHVHAAQKGSVDGEPEAQLTTPFSTLVAAIAQLSGMGEVTLIRETRQGPIRPDFGVLLTKGHRARFVGWIELKAPGIAVDATSWSGRNAAQWAELSKLDVLLVSNGRIARLYRGGVPHGPDAQLPYDSPERWDSLPLIALLRRFLDARPLPVTSVGDLAERLAHRTADLRDRILWLLDRTDRAGATANQAFASWRTLVHPDCSARDFADGVSQVIAYGMVLAVLSTDEADSDHDGVVTIAEAREAIRHISPVMAAAFGPLVEKPELLSAVRVELGALETLVSAINPARVNRSADRRGEPWLYFYEDFLSVYDPEERKQAGVYYTPTAIVQAMVVMVENLLVERFGKRLGFADASVVTLDPATGTGTFPLAVIDQAAMRAERVRGAAGRIQAVANLSKNLIAFELLPGPYSVAQLRIGERLRTLDPTHHAVAQVILTDTLESPIGDTQLALFGDADVLAEEQNRAKRVKAERQVTVVMGNPPYRRVEREIKGRGSGGWVVNGQVTGRKNDKSLFDDILDIAKKNTIFSHHASLYNLYVYFWRWAIWKAFEAHGPGSRIVSFITASSWLAGPGFVGLRKVVRELCDEAWVIDLGGDSKGANPEQNVFAIETPVAVVILVRDAASNKKTAAQVHYRRIRGTAAEKLAAMEEIAQSSDPFAGSWETAPADWMKPFVPLTGDSEWAQMPALADLFPWQQPGCMWNRLWPIAPHPSILKERWAVFARASAEEKPGLFVTSKTGRSVTTQVGRLPKLSEVRAGTPPQPVVRYAFRSFDRQWALQDPRLAALERPALWQSVSNKQIFLVSLMTGKMSSGPVVTITADVPDKHYFRGSFGGKDVIPLYRDADGQVPNVTRGLLETIRKTLSLPQVTPEDLAAYVYALLSAPHYQRRFEEGLRTPGPRVPVTRDPQLWSEGVELGRYLIWLHTYAERFQDAGAGRGSHVPFVPGLGWTTTTTSLPANTSEIRYDEKHQTLIVGEGRLSGVRKEVWDYSVSGMPVVKKWLGYRTEHGTGRAARSSNPLDNVRLDHWPDEWNDELLDLLRVLSLTLDIQPKQADLLDRVCSAPLFSVSDLPAPKPAERKAPKIEKV
jgi:hypothetical protein